MVKLTKTEHIANSAMKLTIEVSSGKTQEVFDEVFSKYKTSMQLPGFRKGKVPENIILRKIGNDIRKETAAKLVEDASEQILKDVEPEPFSQPQLQNFPEFEHGEPYIFEITYDVYPEIEVPDYRDLEIEEPEVSIRKKHVDDQLELIRLYNAVIQDDPDGEVSSDSIVEMDYSELDSEGAPLSGTIHEKFVLDMRRHIHPYEIDADIIGMKTGEQAIIEKKLEDSNIKVQVSIKKISKRILPDLDDELAQDVSEDYRNLSDLRKATKKELQDKTDTMLKKLKIKSVLLKLYESADLPIPLSMLEKEYRDLVLQNGAIFEDMDKDSSSYFESLARTRVGIMLICQKIAKQEKIEVSEDELETSIAERYSVLVEKMKTTTDPEIKRYNQYIKNTVQAEMQQEKLFTFILDSVSIKKGPKMDYDELLQHVRSMPDTGF